ncbi:MAG: GntR family transcriptional regulator [Pseudomonadota bacterium]|nr:GntR family transcriptional regulator [Pseudomonadota bacterium]
MTPSEQEPSKEERRVSAAERVLEHILSEMDAGSLRPGERVNAARIAATLDLSVAPVREALSVLSGRGVLDLLPDRGAVMRLLTPDDVVHLWGVLAPVAAKGLELAAQAISAGAAIAGLAAAFDRIRDQPLSVKPLAFVLRLNDWHFVANQLGGNPFVTRALEGLGVPYWDRYLVNLIDVHQNIDGYLTNYRRMHEAIVAGDAHAARAIFHYHAAWSCKLIEQAAEAQRAARGRKIHVVRQQGG